VIERMVARLGLRERRGLGFQAETEPLRLHQVVITAKPYASTPSKSTTAADLVTGHGVALPIWGFAGSGAGGSSLVLALCPRRALTAGGCTRLRAAPVPACTIHSATEKRKGPLASFTADRSAPRGSLGYVAGDPQLPGGTRLTLAPRPPGLPPPPARPTRGAWPVAQLQAARCAPRASAGAASRSSSGPFEVEARTQGIPWGVLPRASLTERSIFSGPERLLGATSCRGPVARWIGSPPRGWEVRNKTTADETESARRR